MRDFFMTFVIAATMSFACGSSAWSDTSEKGQITEPVAGVPLRFVLLAKGDRIPLQSVIITPRPPRDGYVKLQFIRRDLADDFVREFFYRKSENLLALHPFAEPGVEAVLTSSHLVLTLHRGVAFRIRTDVPGLQSYNTFSTANVMARVVDLKGNIYVSSDASVVEKDLREFFFAIRGRDLDSTDKVYRRPDGSEVTISTERASDLPRRIPPRVVTSGRAP